MTIDHPRTCSAMTLALLLTMSAVGCAATDKRYVKSFHKKHPGCDKSSIEIVRHPDDAVEAKGCETSEVWVYGGIVLTGALDQFAFETGCARDEVEWTTLGGSGYPVGLSGCGHKAVYKQVPYVGWVMDSASSETPAE